MKPNHLSRFNALASGGNLLIRDRTLYHFGTNTVKVELPLNGNLIFCQVFGAQIDGIRRRFNAGQVAAVAKLFLEVIE